MSSYRCALLLLVACMAAVCMDGGEAGTERNILINVGENYTFTCNAHYTSTFTNYWYRSGIPSGYTISYVRGTSVNYDSNFTDRERVVPSYSSNYGRFSLTMRNMTVADSGTYKCTYYSNQWNRWVSIVQYITRVIGCSCTVDQQHMVTFTKNVTCTLASNPSPFSDSPVNIYFKTVFHAYGTVKGNDLTFSTKDDLSEDLGLTLFLSDFDRSFSCVVPAIPITPTTTQITTPSMSTSVTSSTEQPTTAPLVACMAAVCMDGGEAVNVRYILINVGESYTFTCDGPFGSTRYYWYRSGIPSGYTISYLSGTSVSYNSNFRDHERVVSSYSSYYNRFSLTMRNMTVADSGTYKCTYSTQRNRWFSIMQYDTRVMGCSCAVDQQDTATSTGKNVMCTLESNPSPFSDSPVYIYIKKLFHAYGTVQGNELIFSTNNDLREDLVLTLQSGEFDGSFSCVVPAVTMITTTTLEITPSMSTSVTSSTNHTTTPPSTSNPSTPNYVTRTPSVSSATISRVMAPGEQKNKSQRTLIIAISAIGSSMILLLIIVIILLRSRKRQERAPNASNHSENGAKEEKAEVEETDMCYSSIQDTYPPEHLGGSRNTEIKAPSVDNDEMVDNVLYDFTSDYRVSRAIADPTTDDACGPLYAMPDKTSKSADRASVMSKRDLSNGQEAMHPSLASRGRGDVTPSQNGVTRCEDETGDDDGGVAALYAVPDKGPGSRKKAVTHSFAEAADGTGASASYVNVNLSSNTTQPEPGDIAALYAVVDKREKS